MFSKKDRTYSLITRLVSGRQVTPRHRHGLASEAFQVANSPLGSYKPLLNDSRASPVCIKYISVHQLELGILLKYFVWFFVNNSHHVPGPVEAEKLHTIFGNITNTLPPWPRPHWPSPQFNPSYDSNHVQVEVGNIVYHPARVRKLDSGEARWRAESRDRMSSESFSWERIGGNFFERCCYCCCSPPLPAPHHQPRAVCCLALHSHSLHQHSRLVHTALSAQEHTSSTESSQESWE